MMEIFISWSGERSRIFAELFRDFIVEELHPLKAWMSETIPAGKKWILEIINRLEHSNLGIICVTPENQSSPWLLFEAGALSKNLDNSLVCPILIGFSIADLTGPLSLFQAKELNFEGLLNVILTFNKELPDEYRYEETTLKNRFKTRWPKFVKRLEKKLNTATFNTSSTVFSKILGSFRSSGISSEEIGQLVNFNEGYESHTFYEIVLKSAQNRLFFFGRKNRKVFDKEYDWFYKDLLMKSKSGFDFKCLFLDPDSNESILNSAHEDTDFRDQLIKCIESATNTFAKFELPLENRLKKYNFQRPYSIAIVDDVVLFTPIEYSLNGKAKRLTRVSFSMTSVRTHQGMIMVKNFENAWNGSKCII